MRRWLTLLTSLTIVTSNQSVFAQSAATLGQPAPSASIGEPLPSGSALPPYRPIARAAAPDPLVGDYSPAARLGDISEVRTGPGPTTDAATTPEERFNWGVADPAPLGRSGPPPMSESNFGGKVGEYFEKQNFNLTFQSDHCFDTFISPMSNPFLAEDPRALTEIRPILLYQTIPHGSALNGGNLEFLGARGSVAFTDWFSVTLDKIGGLALNPGLGSSVGGGTGFTEVWLGPKFTFYRNEQSGTIAAAGAIFQIPTGPNRIFQGTGDLSITPYATVAQKFGKTSFGEFQVLDTAGFAASVNDQRSDYFYNSAHIDFDVANWNWIFPFLELNWFHYTNNGNSSDLGIEGADIANIGSAVAGRNYLDLAVGSRFKVSQTVELGFMADFPLLARDLFGFRLGVDVIWRY
jgi:hypothetical protein